MALRQKEEKLFDNSALLVKKFSKFIQEMFMTWIRIHFCPMRIRDPDLHQNQIDPKHMKISLSFKTAILVQI